MFKHIFELDKTIGIYPLISLAIFFLFFMALLVWVVRADKAYLFHMGHLPLEDNEIQGNNTLAPAIIKLSKANPKTHQSHV